MSEVLGQVWASLNRRTAAVLFLVAQVAFGVAVVGHAMVLGDLFIRPEFRSALDLDGAFLLTSEQDDVTLAERDLAALRALPGVRAAAWSARDPFGLRQLPERVAAGGRSASAWTLCGTAEIASALGLEAVEGRPLRDGEAGEPVLISAALARELFPGGSAIGREIASVVSAPPHRVVGLVQSGWFASPFGPWAENALVRPARPAAARRAWFLIRVDPAFRATFPGGAEAALRALSPARYLLVETLRHTMARRLEVNRGTVVILVAIVTFVLGVVLVGAAAMSSFFVAERTREIGIRRALGATRRQIVRYFVAENLALSAIGLAAGCALSYALNRLLVIHFVPFAVLGFEHLVLGVLLFGSTGLIAAIIPALRAARVPPSVASRTV